MPPAPGAASNRRGLTVVAWFEQRDGVRLMVAHRSPGGWQEPVAIDQRLPQGRRVVGPAVVVNDAGAVVVWWDEVLEEVDCGDRWWSYVMYASPAGVWDAPHEVGDGSCEGGMAAAAIGVRGNVNVAYRTASGLRFTRRAVDRGWTPPRVISRHQTRFQPALMRTPRGGTLVVAWERGDESGYAARRRIDGRWGRVRSWAPKHGAGGSWDAAMAGHGTATLGWMDEAGAVRVKRWPRRGPLSRQRILLERTDLESELSSLELEIAAGAEGDTVVGYGVKNHLQLLYRPRGGPWRPSPPLPRHTGMTGYQLAVRPAGAVDVAWAADRYGAHPGIWSSRYTP